MEEGQICILCNKTCEEKAKVVRIEDWEKLKDIAYNWKSLDNYGEVYETVEWESGPANKFWHADCKREVCGTRKLDQARKRKRKSDYYGSDVLNTKEGEHKNRSKAFSGGYAKNIFPSKDQKFPSKREFSDFFHNPSNKIRLQTFLKASLCKTIRGLYTTKGRNMKIFLLHF